MSFELNERLAKGGFLVGRFHGCQLLLKNNAHFLWFILVPEVPNGEEEIHELPVAQAEEVFAAIREISEFLQTSLGADKVNWASIGNQVRQMHIHVVGRFENDVAWPGVIWSCKEKQPYEVEAAGAIVEQARSVLKVETGS